MPRRLTLLLLCAGALLSAAPAAAQQSTAPPGNAGIDEYVETVPGASGNRTPRERGRRGGGILPAEARRALEREGADGERLAQLIQQTADAPARRAPRGERDRDGTPEPAAPGLRDGGESPLAAVVSAATGSGGPSGMGIVFPLLIAVSLLAVIAAVLVRKRTAR